jgi:anti-sigma-K factor RskA
VTGRVLRFESGTHRVVDALLPWYVNGTLEGDELDGVRHHLSQCAQCREEVAWLRELHAACVAAESMPGAGNAFRSLRHKLEGRATKGGLSSRLGRVWSHGSTWTRWAAAASLAMVLALGASLLQEARGPTLYHTLGASGTTERASGSLIVVFDPATTEADLRRILRQADARLVDGPTRANAYVLDVPAGRRQDVMHMLRAQRAVVRVEQLGPEDSQ